MRLVDIPISKLMSTNITRLNQADTIGFAILQMIKTRFSRLPVLDNGRLVGIFTSTDIIRIIHKSQSIDVLQEKLSQHMSANIITASPDQKFGEILGIMAEKNVSCLPITSEDGKLEGIYTNKDFLLFNIFWSETQDVIIDEDNSYLQKISEQFILPVKTTIGNIIEVMSSHDLNYVIVQDDEKDMRFSISKDRVIKSIASNLIIKGFEMKYLDKEVLDIIVTDPLFTMEIGQTLNSYRKFMNRRGIDSLFLTSDDEIKFILNEESIKDTAYAELIADLITS